MTTRSSQGLTPKQRKVCDMLGEGLHPNAIAERMKVTPSAVYAHMRNIRQAGVALPTEQLPAEPAAKPAPPPEPEALTNGVANPEAALRTAVDGANHRLEEIDREVEALRAQEQALGEERAGIETQAEKYQAALSALA